MPLNSYCLTLTNESLYSVRASLRKSVVIIIKKLFRRLALLLTPAVCCLFIAVGLTDYFSPDTITAAGAVSSFISGDFPLSLRYRSDSVAVQAESQSDTTLTADLMLFGFFPVKQVSVTVTPRKTILTGGMPFGIRLYTDGLVVSSVSPVSTSQGSADPAGNADIQPGDILLSVNGTPLKTNEQLAQSVSTSDGEPLLIQVKRNGRCFTTSVTPAFDVHANAFKLGLHIRDSIAGIGTMSCIDPDTLTFAGLGHGICDAASGCLMPLNEGDIVKTEITSVTKGICGNPGTLSGCFDNDKAQGILTMNTDHGVFGKLLIPPDSSEPIPVAYRQEVVRGPAELVTTVSGSSPQHYRIEIEDISYNDRSSLKNMVIHVTDEKLLQQTGGIVQGMSGSPILQNGKFAGVVTHVFVNDPTHGYALFAESMMQELPKQNN